MCLIPCLLSLISFPSPPPMSLVQSTADLRSLLAAERAKGNRIGFVPTMGALHRGHMSLVSAARRECDVVVASIFVNPTQFGPGEDFERYPRTLDADCELLAQENVEYVFAPPVEEVYPPGAQTWVEVQGPATATLEGVRRPGHFRGVTTVVATLFHLVGPDVAYFGQKDYQQTVVLRQMTRDLAFPLEIRVCPTVRDPDGLALSSRNQYLSEPERAQALSLSRGLFSARETFDTGERNPAALRNVVQDTLQSTNGVAIDYVAIVDPETLAPLEGAQSAERCVIAIAARVGKTRLIDNLILGMEPPAPQE